MTENQLCELVKMAAYEKHLVELLEKDASWLGGIGRGIGKLFGRGAAKGVTSGTIGTVGRKGGGGFFSRLFGRKAAPTASKAATTVSKVAPKKSVMVSHRATAGGTTKYVDPQTAKKMIPKTTPKTPVASKAAPAAPKKSYTSPKVTTGGGALGAPAVSGSARNMAGIPGGKFISEGWGQLKNLPSAIGQHGLTGNVLRQHGKGLALGAGGLGAGYLGYKGLTGRRQDYR